MMTAEIKRQSLRARVTILNPIIMVAHEATGMKTLALIASLGVAGLLAGCISSSNPPPPAKTTVVVPPSDHTTVVCQDGSKPPCN
jgi:hypothetical protein